MVSRKNFTLLEISIASVVFAIAILSTLAALSVNFKLQASNKETSIAMNAANEKLSMLLTDPLLFRKVNDSLVDLTTVNTGNLTNPYNWARNGTQFWTAEFQVAGVNVQEGTTSAGSICINNIYGNAPGLPPAGIDFLDIIVVVRWTGVSGNRRVVLQGQRYRLKEDSDLQTAPSIP